MTNTNTNIAASISVIDTKAIPVDLATNQTVINIGRTDGKKGKSGKCAIVPAYSINTLQAILSNEVGEAWVMSAVNDLRGKIATALVKAGKSITETDVALTAILAAMRVETESQRMTKESIGAWFDNDLAALVDLRIREKMAGISQDKLDKLVKGYRDSFQQLAGRDVSMPDSIKNQLIRALELLPADYDSVIGEKVTAALLAVTEASVTLAAL